MFRPYVSNPQFNMYYTAHMQEVYDWLKNYKGILHKFCLRPLNYIYIYIFSVEFSFYLLVYRYYIRVAVLAYRTHAYFGHSRFCLDWWIQTLCLIFNLIITYFFPNYYLINYGPIYFYHCNNNLICIFISYAEHNYMNVDRMYLPIQYGNVIVKITVSIYKYKLNTVINFSEF